MCSHFFAFFAFLFMKLLPINLKYLFAHHTSSVLQFLDLKAQWRSCFFCGSSETGMVHHWRLMLNWCFKIRLRIYLFSLTFECVCLSFLKIILGTLFGTAFLLAFTSFTAHKKNCSGFLEYSISNKHPFAPSHYRFLNSCVSTLCQILSYPNKPYINGKLIYFSFQVIYNSRFKMFYPYCGFRGFVVTYFHGLGPFGLDLPLGSNWNELVLTTTLL